MANVQKGKFWLCDSAGLVWENSVYINNVMITWKVASAGTVDMAEFDRDSGGVRDSFLYAQTLGATSAAQDQLTQIFPIENIVQGLWISTIANVAKLIINTK